MHRMRAGKFPLIFAILAMALLFGACGDYQPCKTLAYRICTECPHVADHWEAACLCLENGTLKENGYKCQDVTSEDEVRCNSELENWNEESCELLN